jgi:hypothetical protein
MENRMGVLELENDTLREENAGLRALLAELQPKPKCLGQRRGKNGTPKRVIDLLTESAARMTLTDFQAALPDVRSMTIYMALRDLRLATPPIVDVKGSGFNNDPYRYGLVGKSYEPA